MTSMTLIRARPLDDYGDPIGEPERVGVPSVAVEWLDSRPASPDRPHQVTTRLRLYGPVGLAVGAGDTVELDGVAYEVTGVPSEPVSPFTGWSPGVVIECQRVTG